MSPRCSPLFVWGGLRYDVVALLALAAALLTGVVPADKAFLGFASPAIIIIIIASVLILSRAIAISCAVEPEPRGVAFPPPGRESNESTRPESAKWLLWVALAAALIFSLSPLHDHHAPEPAPGAVSSPQR